MLPPDRLKLALEIHSRSYELLKWVAEAVHKGFIPATNAHRYASLTDVSFAWVEEHYLNLPERVRPSRQHLREFANFFATYVTSSFDIVEQPGTRLDSRCGCYCPMCSHLVNAPHLRVKKPTKRDKGRAQQLKVTRVTALAFEEGIETNEAHVGAIVARYDPARSAALSTYGYWLIRRLDGDTDGTAVLALWREIAWTRTGSPIRNYKLQQSDFVEAERLLTLALQSST